MQTQGVRKGHFMDNENVETRNPFTKLEMETIVNYNNAEKMAEVYTADPVVMRKLDALCEKYPEDYECYQRTEWDANYRFSKKLVSFRTPVHLTEEQKEQSRKNLAKANARKAELEQQAGNQ